MSEQLPDYERGSRGELVLDVGAQPLLQDRIGGTPAGSPSASQATSS